MIYHMKREKLLEAVKFCLLFFSVFIFFLGSLLFGGDALSQEVKGYNNNYNNSYDIGYLLVDKTKTPWGHKFFQEFSLLWKPPKGIKGYFVYVTEEKPSTRQSWIVVKVGDNIYMKPVYVKLMRPTVSDFDMQRYALQAAKNVLRYLLTDFEKLKLMEERM